MTNKFETAIFGGGCFWCTEAVYQMVKGIKSVAPGYSGGETLNPTYSSVSEGYTGHAEVIKIEFDPVEISFEDLLTVFFATHDPTTLNRQGNDVGTQYRSIILYTDEDQKKIAENFIKKLNESDPAGKSVVTELKPFEKFYEAEEYHKNYYLNNPDKPYCQLIIEPKVQKLQAKLSKFLR